MKKISTFFKKDPNDLGRVINEINSENAWVLTTGVATRKYDGTACMIKDGVLYKRYDAKRDKRTGQYKSIPDGAIACQEADEVTGHHPHWVRVTEQDKWHLQAFKDDLPDGTYELCGERVQSNPEKLVGHHLIPHGKDIIDLPDLSFEGIKEYLTTHDIEGIVFHDTASDKMCKIRKGDFGIKR